ncbi:hypothetical protein CYLTODRAFT_484834 [Cylindrobasidium torrendii FP15055 ss-10]|uniref:F-box domain-containing protein n=1 Tax=Cylindrobasidium torrendii FP15055 ss-10 TaxID=1314674 RepID=A0A0D7BV70_9AGAR|nr:hypothetical protein CYLTODRAFT_484834 [Cylindrobasidium torrendii FP15055 ss-10]
MQGKTKKSASLLCCHCGRSPTPKRQKHLSPAFESYLGGQFDKGTALHRSVQKHITDIEAEVAGLDQDIIHTEIHLRELRASRERAHEAARRHRTLTSRFYSLPIDVLIKIFMLFTHHCSTFDRALWTADKDEKQGPWLLAQVCSWWRAIANGTPMLWASMLIHGASPRPLIEMALERVGHAPINLAFAVSKGTPATELLLRKSSQFRDLFFAKDATDMLSLLGKPESLGTMPMLKRVTIMDAYVQDGHIFSYLEPFRDCTTLEYLVLQLTHKYHPDPVPPPNSKPSQYERFKLFKNLKRLSMLESFCPLILPHCRDLEGLIVFGCPSSHQALGRLPVPEKVITLPSLTLFHTYDDSKILSSLNCPSLTDLDTVGTVRDALEPFLRRSECPLQTLDIEHPFSCWSSSIPAFNDTLTSLALWPVSGSTTWRTHLAQDVVPHLVDGTFPNLKRLQIRGPYVRECANWDMFGRLVEKRCVRPTKMAPGAFIGHLHIAVDMVDAPPRFMQTMFSKREMASSLLVKKLASLKHQPGGPPSSLSAEWEPGNQRIIVKIEYNAGKEI